MSQVDFYYDFSCPWSYIALIRLQDVCERNRAKLVFKPVAVEQILATENPARQKDRFAANPAKASWERRDLNDWANFWGLTINLADDWPRDRDTASAAALAAIEAGEGMAFSRALFRAQFRDNDDISDPAALRRVAAECDLDADAIAASATADAALTQVRKNSLELIERGGFGTPSMFVDDILFYGNDRIALVEWTLGPLGDEEFVIPGQHNG
ncbi:MAG: DsbA family protein [Gammaproteobacteria bacterium]|nr:DsbA family protein [Gammaproteobacteria bacterium]